MDPVIQLKDVYYRYPNIEEDVIRGVTVDILNQHIVTILGPNGSGKSTLAKLLNGLLLPDEGIVIVDKIDTSNAKEQIWEIRSNVGMVFQNPDNQIVASTVEEDVAFGLENMGIKTDIIRERVDNALNKVSLSSYKLVEPHHLSGGQKQKVAIAGIIAMKPKVIIFDEATSMLDPRGRKDVINTLVQLNKDENITIINITHFLQEALIADLVILMHNGKILMQGKPKNILTKREILKNIGLDVPISVELAYRLRKKGFPFPEDILTEEEFVNKLWTLI